MVGLVALASVGAIGALVSLTEAQIHYTPPSSYTPCVTLCGLTHYWGFDEASGARLDWVGHADFSDSTGVMSAAGMHNLAGDFERTPSKQYVSVPFSIAGPEYDPGLTVSLWYNAESDTTSNYLLMFLLGSTSTFEFSVDHGIVRVKSSGKTVNVGASDTGAWHHLIGWFDPSTMKLYGQRDGGTVVESTVAASWTRDATTLFIGTLAVGEPNTWDGLIDEVAVWPLVLTDAERTALYNSGTGKFYNGSVFALYFREQPWRYAKADWFYYHPQRPPLGLRALNARSH